MRKFETHILQRLRLVQRLRPIQSLRPQAALFLFALVITGFPLVAQNLSGRRAPSFSLQDANLQQQDILDYRGRWLLIDFMKTDCPHCKALTKVLEGVKAKYGQKVSVLSLVLSPPDTQATVNRYMAENKVSTPILFDMGQVAIAYFKATPQHNSYDTPHLFAVDPAGIIVRDWTTAGVEEPGFLGQLQQLLDGKK